MANNGQYRCKEVTITKLDSEGATEAGYPVVYDMTDVAFVYNGGTLTDSDIANALDGSVGDVGTWNDMVEEFRLWIEGQEANLDIQSQQLNLPYGTDTVTCPISYGDYF